MKRLIGLGALGCLALLSIFAWFSRDPSTELLDSSGAPLVAQERSQTGEEVGEDQLFAKALRLLEASRFAEAKVELLRILEEEQQDGMACILLSRATRELKQIEEAVDYGLKAVELLPEHAPAHLAYGRALGVQLMGGINGVSDLLMAKARIDRFKAELDLVVKYDPQDIEARTMQVFAAMAPLVGNKQRAIDVALEIQEIDGLRGSKMLSYAYSNMGDTPKAIDVCVAAQEAYPKDNGFALILGGLYRDEEQLEAARQAYAQTRAIGPQNEDYHLSQFRQAELQVEAGVELEEALGLVQRFIAAKPVGDWIPSAAKAQHLLGRAQLALGNTEEARSAWEECLRLEPDHKPARKALKGLE